jgi:hypothetical protein
MRPPPNTDTTSGEDRVAEAAAALGRGEWEPALEALAAALCANPFNPFRPEWGSLFDRALEAAGDRADEVLHQLNHHSVVTRGMRAYAAHRRGDVAFAFRTIEALTREGGGFFPEAWGFGRITPDTARAAGADALEMLFTAVDRIPENTNE